MVIVWFCNDLMTCLETNQQIINLLVNLLANNANGSSVTTPSPPQMRHPLPPNQAGIDNNLFLTALRLSQNQIQSNNSTAANTFTTNQLLNLQATLSALNLLSNRDNESADISVLVKLLTAMNAQPPNSASPTTTSTTNNNNYNSGLLASIAGLFSSTNGNNNESLAELITVIAAAIDSNKCQQATGYQSRHMPQNASPSSTYMGRGLRHSPTFGAQPPNPPTFHRRPMSEVLVPPSHYGQRISNVEGDIDRAATIYRNSASKQSFFWRGWVGFRQTCDAQL